MTPESGLPTEIAPAQKRSRRRRRHDEDRLLQSRARATPNANCEQHVALRGPALQGRTGGTASGSRRPELPVAQVQEVPQLQPARSKSVEVTESLAAREAGTSVRKAIVDLRRSRPAENQRRSPGGGVRRPEGRNPLQRERSACRRPSRSSAQESRTGLRHARPRTVTYDSLGPSDDLQRRRRQRSENDLRPPRPAGDGQRRQRHPDDGLRPDHSGLLIELEDSAAGHLHR